MGTALVSKTGTPRPSRSAQTSDEGNELLGTRTGRTGSPPNPEGQLRVLGYCKEHTKLKPIKKGTAVT